MRSDQVSRATSDLEFVVSGDSLTSGGDTSVVSLPVTHSYVEESDWFFIA